MTNEDLEQGRFTCPHCDDRLDTVGDKKRHIRTKHPEKAKR